MYRIGGSVGGAGLVAGAGATASDVSPAELARTGGPLLLIAITGLALIVVGFLMVRSHLQAVEERA